MTKLMNQLVIAPIIDKEFLVVSGWGYDKQISDGLFTITHIDTLPNPEQKYDDRGVAMRKYADGVKSYSELKVFLGLWQTSKINHFSLIQGWSSADAKIKFDADPATIEFKNTIYPLGGTIGGCPWDEQYTSLEQHYTFDETTKSE